MDGLRQILNAIRQHAFKKIEEDAKNPSAAVVLEQLRSRLDGNEQPAAHSIPGARIGATRRIERSKRIL